MANSFPALVIATALGVTPALADGPLDGWTGYKFGMSPDAARAVPGQVFGAYSPKNLMNENQGAMGAKKKSSLYGLSWSLNLFFDAGSKLNTISLENEKKSSRDACQLTFLTLLAQVEKSYGGLSPVNPERKRSDTDTPPTSVEYRVQGASRYQLAILSLSDEYAYGWKARKSVGGNYVDLATTWSGKPDGPQAACIADINFSGK